MDDEAIELDTSGNEVVRVARGRSRKGTGDDTEALLEAKARRNLPPIAYPRDSPLEINDLPVVAGGRDALSDSLGDRTTTPSNGPNINNDQHSAASISRVNFVNASPSKVTTPWSVRVAPSPDDLDDLLSDRSSPELPSNFPGELEGEAASIFSASTASMPRADGGLDREDTVEMSLVQRRLAAGGAGDRKPRYAPSWPTQDALDNAEGLGGGLLSESNEDLSILISIHQAARDGEVEVMRRFLDQIGSNKRKRVNKLDENNLSALHYAARYNHIEIVKLLIKHQADPRCRGEDKTTPMHYAARCKRSSSKTAAAVTAQGGNDDDDEDEDGDVASGIISYLEAEGADVNAQDIYGQTPLHFAAMRGNDIAAAELLNSPKVLFEAVDKQVMTPLHMACTHGNLQIAKMLIEKGAALRCKDEEANTPLLVACTEGHIEIVQLLFQAGDNQGMLPQMLTDPDIDNNTPIHVAVDSGKRELVQMCLEKGANINTHDKQRNTPLHIAAAAGHLDIVKLLLNKQTNIDAVNLDRSTALHRACANNRHLVVEYLLKNGARIERRDKDNFTPLLIAASNGHSGTIDVLLKRGANIRAVDKHEKSSVFWAAQENEIQTLTVLLDHRKHKAKKLLMESDRYNNTPLHVAAEKGYINIVKILLDRGASLEAKNEEELTALHLAARHGRVHTLKELVRRDETGINDEDEDSNTPLHLAAMEGHAKCVLALIDTGADIEARNQSQWTPLDCSAANGWVKCATALLENDCPVDPIDKTKTTPLHLASRNGHVDMVKLLCRWGANLSLKDDNNHNCLDLAIDKGHENVARVIVGLKNWLHAMYSAYDDKFTKLRCTPMRLLIKKMPDVAEMVFNRCVTENEHPPESDKYCITFDYELLDDMFSKWDDTISPDNVSEVSGGSDDNSPFLESGKLSQHAAPYTASSKVLRMNHPLTIMVNSKRDELLGHPLVTSLMQHKWDSYGRFFYYSSLVFYSIFLVFLTGYVTTNPPSFYYYMNRTARTFSWVANGEDRWERDFSLGTHFLFGRVGHWVIIILSAINILKEVVQLYHQKLNYIGWVNLLEWAIYSLSVLFVLPLSEVYYPYGGAVDCTGSTETNCIMLRLSWQWQCGGVAVFLAWINLIMFLRKFPQFGIYIVMFTDVLKTFLHFAIVFFLFIIAFGLAFYSLLQNQQSFHRVQYALVKTFVMMIGEFEFDSLFHGLDYLNVGQEGMGEEELFLNEVYYTGITYALFVIFVIIMSIIIMNLLVGLAVDDIKEVQAQAKLKRLGMQVNLAMEVQEALPSFMWRRSIMKQLSVHPNQQSETIFTRFYHWYSGREELLSNAISTALNPPKTDLEEIQEQQEELAGAVKNIKYRLKMMRAQNDRMEGMLEALLKKGDVQFEEGEASEEVGE